MSPLPRCSRCTVNPVGYIGRECCYTCVPRMKLGPRPRSCSRCGINPVGYSGRECCYRCVPRRRRAPLVCKRCGSDDFFTAGLCRRCHRSAVVVDSCRDCLAWGVTRHEKWLCQACRGWRRRDLNEVTCPSCTRQVVVNGRGFCRLCCRGATTANNAQPAHIALDVVGVNRTGQQLFFADLILKKRGKRPAPPRPMPPGVLWPRRFPVGHHQLVLFPWPHHLDNQRARHLQAPIPELAAALFQAVEEHGDRHGWSDNLRKRARWGIRVLLALQDTPGARITTSETTRLLQLEGPTMRPVLDVLVSVDMLTDDRPAPLESWFDAQVAELPEPMRDELADWFHALRDGSTRTPRMRPRHIDTVYNSVRPVLPVVRAWASDGHQSLREITSSDVITALAGSGRRGHTLSALRSLFRYLKARKLVFVNPTARLRGDQIQSNQPLPIELNVVRDAINSSDPVRAALAALFAFHALRTGEARTLQLIDIRDGRLQVNDNRMVLADPAHQRINAWLAERARRWPNTINPHLFINSYTAVRTTAVSNVWIIDMLGVSAQKIREDRILHEAIATEGDVRRLSDLFGISVQTAQRYVDVIAKPDERALVDITRSPTRSGSRTQGRN